MKSGHSIPVKLAVCLLAALWLFVSGAWAKPTTPDQAKTVVMNWLGKDALPLGAPLGRQIKEVQTFSDEAGMPVYYVVHLNPAGMVFLPADDLVEPIIGFMPDGLYDPSPTNPLGALVSRDLPGRVLQARQVEAMGLEALAPQTPQAKAQRKWDWLQNSNSGLEGLEASLPSISDVRVAPFVQSRWSQSTASGSSNYCYNYYTPNHYVCGCVATAMSQLMRFHQYPVLPVVSTFTIHVGGVAQSATIRGGNGSGGNYDWANMTLVPNASTGDPQRAAIGALTYDAGVAVSMWYDTDANGGSGADTLYAANAFRNTFRYSNAKRGYDSGNNLSNTQRNNMVNPNLHAQYPILFGITGDGGHAIVCDGYGYNSATMYHHLNMGWSGSDDAWYNLPDITTTYYAFNSVYKCVYNVFTSGSGEIIAGRVTEANGTTPVSGVTVTATRSGGGTYNALAPTNAYGIYAIPKVPSASSYTVSASKTGYTFTPQAVSTGTSTDDTPTTGNSWTVNFAAGGGPSLNLNQALDNTKLSFTTSGGANWFPETATYYYGGSAAQSGDIGDSQYSSLQTTVVGPGKLSFYWKVSCEEGWDYLDIYIDGRDTDWITGSVDWTQRTYNIPAGIHTIIWEYSKDDSVSEGSDCGWVDKVVFTRGGGSAIYKLLLLQ